jgi:hypothetical protein
MQRKMPGRVTGRLSIASINSAIKFSKTVAMRTLESTAWTPWWRAPSG